MNLAARALIAFVAFEHLCFLVLEMFLWDTPLGIRFFGLTPAFAEQTSTLAANQGLYNGFLVVGLIWSLTRKSQAFALQVFFLTCVVVAGVFGALTASASILMIQAAPGMVALALVGLSPRTRPVYAIAQGRIENRELLNQYVAKVIPTIQAGGGRILGFDETPEQVEGEVAYPRTVIVEFASREVFRTWYDSSEYQAILPLRLQSMPGTLILVDGLPS